MKALLLAALLLLAGCAEGSLMRGLDSLVAISGAIGRA